LVSLVHWGYFIQGSIGHAFFGEDRRGSQLIRLPA